MAQSYARSFAGGEIAPELFGRIELGKRQTGLKLAKNFWVLPHGPLQNRAGLEYVLDAKVSTSKARIYDFTFSDEQGYCLEFGSGYIRVHVNGGTLLEASKTIVSISQAANGVINIPSHGYLTGDWIFLSVPSGMTQLNGRFVQVEIVDANNLKILHLGVRNYAFIDTTTYGAYVSGGTASRVFTLASPYSDSDIFNLNFTQSADVLSIAHPSYDTLELRRVGVNTFPFTEQTNPKNISLNSVAYSSSLDLFAAVGDPDGTDAYIVTSPNGITWTERANPKNLALVKVVWDGTRFTAVGVADGTDAYIISSTDGITWAERANPKAFGLNSVASNGSTIVAVGDADGGDAYIVFSTNGGTTWTESANPKNVGLLSLAWNGSIFLAAGFSTGSPAGSSVMYLASSPDGITWTDRSAQFGFGFSFNPFMRALAWDGARFCGMVTDGLTLRAVYDADGIPGFGGWEKAVDLGNVPHVVDLIHNGSIFMGVGQAGGGTPTIFTSALDGETWTKRIANKNFALFGVAWDGDQFVTVGKNDGVDSYILTTPYFSTPFELVTTNFDPSIAAPASVTATPTGPGGGTPSNHIYVATALADVTLEESFASPVSNTVSLDLTVVGNFITVVPAAVAETVRYNIFKKLNGLFGYIGQTDGSGLVDNNITPDMTITPPIAGPVFTGVGNRPSAVGYAEGRKAYAASDSEPQSFWLTRSGTEKNMTYSIPTRDDDAISATLKAQKVNRIRHIVPLDNLVLLTIGGAWEVRAAGDTGVLTPASIWPKKRSVAGASKVNVLLAANSALYVGNTGNKIYELTWRESSGGISAVQAQIMAPHLFKGRTIVDAAYTETLSTAWFVCDDGVMLGFTYLPEHEVLAWHQHAAGGNGLFESVASVRENFRDILHAVIKRTINGNSVRYIERLTDRDFLDVQDAVFVDSAVTYSGTPATVLSGLWHLEGESVKGLADGAIVGPLVVDAEGKVTLAVAASKVSLGLPITADAETLPLAMENVEAAGQGKLKTIGRVLLGVVDSATFKVGPDFDNLKQVAIRAPIGSPPPLVTKTLPITITSLWKNDSGVAIRHEDPTPLTIAFMVLDSETGG